MPEDHRDESSGRYTNKYPDHDFIDAIDSLGGAAGTQEIADEVGCIYDTAYSKLVHLEDEERVTSRKIANARLWSLTNE
jgi:hypothetical protein